ncbi:MAG: hypothetical protein ACREAC_09040, partial [Blastocatellia bacterium]
MKILLVQSMLYAPSLGGANKASRRLLEGLAESSHVCRAIAPSTGSHGPQSREEFRETLRLSGIELASTYNGIDLFRQNGVEVHALSITSELAGYTALQASDFEPDITIVASQDPGQMLLEAALKTEIGQVVSLVQAPWDLPFGPSAIFPSRKGTE